MEQPIIETLCETCAVVWQQVEDGVPEPAIIVTSYSDIIELKQEDRYINLNYETVIKLCAYLKGLKPEK